MLKPSQRTWFLLMAVAVLVISLAGGAFSESESENRLRQVAGSQASPSHEVSELLNRGTSPNVPDWMGRTAIHAAAAIGAVEKLRLLLDAGGIPAASDNQGNTPLHLASDVSSQALAESDSKAAIRLLLFYGANPGSANDLGETPLHLAAASHNMFMPIGVNALLSAGGHPNWRDVRGNTPLHAAIGGFANENVIRALLDADADPKQKNGAGLTALQMYVSRAPDNGAGVVALLAAGADPNQKNPDGDTPLHSAIYSGHKSEKIEVVGALLQGGADPCLKDSAGFIPYQSALRGGEVRVALARAGGRESDCATIQSTTNPIASGRLREMQATKRSNVRSGPGTSYSKVGLLQVGERVQVTGEVGSWLQIEMRDGSLAYVYKPLLTEVSAERAPIVQPRTNPVQPSQNAVNLETLREVRRQRNDAYKEFQQAQADALNPVTTLVVGVLGESLGGVKESLNVRLEQTEAQYRGIDARFRELCDGYNWQSAAERASEGC